MAVLLAGLPTSVPAHHRQPPVRLEPRRRDAGQPRDRDRRRRRRAGRRRRVDEPRAVGRAQAREGLPGRPADDALDDARLAHGQPGDARAVDDLARREHREARRHLQRSDREAQDAFALRSHQLAAAAWDAGFYDDWVVPVAETELLARRGHPRRLSLEKLAKLKPAFVKDGTVTAGNASPLNDGAAAVLIGERGGARRPAASRSRGSPGAARSPSTPTSSASAPSRRRTGRSSAPGSAGATSTLVELNEAFAAQSLACVGEWPIDPERVNVNGGAIAIGHPLGASGARILGTLALRAARATAGATASPRSASASARDWPSFWRPRDASATTRDIASPARLRGLQVDRAAPPEAAADRAPAPADRS